MGSAILRLGPASNPPGDCFICSCRPVDEEGELREFIYPEGMDINWGETPYICWDCAGIMADLIGRPDAEKIKAVLRGARLQKKHNTKLLAENEELRTSLQALLDGREASEKAKELMSNA
jgi:hypothetical protein